MNILESPFAKGRYATGNVSALKNMNRVALIDIGTAAMNLSEYNIFTMYGMDRTKQISIGAIRRTHISICWLIILLERVVSLHAADNRGKKSASIATNTIEAYETIMM